VQIPETKDKPLPALTTEAATTTSEVTTNATTNLATETTTKLPLSPSTNTHGQTNVSTTTGKKAHSPISKANAEISVESPSAGSLTLNPPKVDIHSHDVLRATFSHVVENKEPNTLIADTVVLDSSGLSRVHFYNEISGRTGDILTHTWYRNGKKVVKVRIPVGGDNWRCSSSKYLDRTMAGEWEVKVTDKKGNLVASGSFQFATS